MDSARLIKSEPTRIRAQDSLHELFRHCIQPQDHFMEERTKKVKYANIIC